jgi:hypothetical protein
MHKVDASLLRRHVIGRVLRRHAIGHETGAEDK